MANWWFIYLRNINDTVLIFGPLIFIGINYWSCKLKKGKEYGMTLFCVSLSVLVFITTLNKNLIMPATTAIMVLGYADPIAAIVGRGFQKKMRRPLKKSLLGSFAFMIVSIIILMIFFRAYNESVKVYELVVVSALFAAVENKVFPKYDNLMVPLSVFTYVYIRGVLCGFY